MEDSSESQNPDFLSDSDENIIDPSKSKSNSSLTIATLLSNVKKYILSLSGSSKMELDVEIMNIQAYKSMIFLKLSDTTAIISGILYNACKNELKIGDKIKIFYKIDIYNDHIQLNISSFKYIGDGVKNLKMKQLEKKLKSQGYFERRILEHNYKNIGVISSLNSAGFRDFVHTLNERCVNKKIYIYPASMQDAMLFQKSRTP